MKNFEVPAQIKALACLAAFGGTMLAWDSYSPWGHAAALAQAKERLDGKCVRNAAGGAGVVEEVREDGKLLIAFKSGVRGMYPEAAVTVSDCGASASS
jgi:hypothetical protein